MKTVSTLVLSLLLSVCLTLYGPFGMARAGGESVFSMEICADGFAKTVLFDADGNPVEPAAICHDCLTCCQAVGSSDPQNNLATSAFGSFEMVLGQRFTQNLTPNKRHIFPAPRGPPAMQVSTVIKKTLITADRLAFGQMTRSDGRPASKDANA
jgi:hypothetical protein